VQNLSIACRTLKNDIEFDKKLILLMMLLVMTTSIFENKIYEEIMREFTQISI